jgi:urease beta subunit
LSTQFPLAVLPGPSGEIYYVDGGKLIRILANGEQDPGFEVTVGIVRAIAFFPDSTLVIGGDFATVNGQPMRAIAHLQANGQLVPGFASPYEGAQDNVYLPVVHTLYAMEDGSVLAGSNIRLAAGKAPGRQDYIQRIQVLMPGGNPDPAPGFAGWLESFELPPGLDGPDDDADGDGISNRAEYVLGGNPTIPNSAQWPVGVGVDVDGVNYPAVQFTRNRLAVGASIEVTASTSVLFNPPAETVEVVEDLGNGVERVTVRSTAPLPDVTTFFFEIRLVSGNP